jgi:hypothetical protein
MKHTLYRVVDYKTGYHRTIMFMTDMDGMYMDRFWDFGSTDVFDVAKTIEIFNEIKVSVESITKTEFKKKFGKAFYI